MATTMLQLKVTIHGTKPSVWRRVVVSDEMSLGVLHEVLQAAFGWTDSHLHEFEIAGTRYGIDDGEDDEPPEDEHRTKLRDVASVGATFDYTYDFGDDWRHKITVEKALEDEQGSGSPRCIEGRRACPPEDCGGAGGYEDLLAVLVDPNHEDHADVLEWVGKDFDPEAFDVNEANRRMPHARRASARHAKNGS